jgi:dTDP-4-dehydrorhamnose reductase
VKILLLGKGGQIGWELQRALAPLGEIVAPARDAVAPRTGDLAQLDDLCKTVRTVAPDVIVNAAAYTAVDKAESEPELAGVVNAIAPGVIAREAAALGARLVHFSTDYVFDGSGDLPWAEHSPTGPLNVYGRSKLEGEELIRASACKHIILRTSWVYAARGNNFAKTMLRLAAERDSLAVIDDQVGAPTGAELLADVTAHVLRALRSKLELCGTYHVAAAGETTWHGYARHVIDFARAAGQPIKVAPDAVRPVPTSAYPTPARRPGNSRMDTTRIRQAFNLTLPHWTVGMDRTLTELLER